MTELKFTEVCKNDWEEVYDIVSWLFKDCKEKNIEACVLDALELFNWYNHEKVDCHFGP